MKCSKRENGELPKTLCADIVGVIFGILVLTILACWICGKTPHSLYVATPNPPGLVASGNIDLLSRPNVHNADGSYSSVRSISIESDNMIYLIPTVVNTGHGWHVATDGEAVQVWRATGQHLGVFKDEASAEVYAEQLHEQQAGLGKNQ